MLFSSARPLVDAHDLVMLDLDGVVYVGGQAVPGAADAVRRLEHGGGRAAYVTNNASRTPETVAAHLRALGLPATADGVVTAAQAAAAVLLDRHGTGGAVFLAGGEGLEQALVAVGLLPVTDPDRPVDAVVTGFGPDLPWLRVVQAGVLIARGVPWVAANADLTFPTERGIAPGHGALVRLLEEFSGIAPTVAGKPQPPLLEQTVQRSGSTRPLMVGDRLDTDILGAHAVGVPSLLVLTGVTGLPELVAAPPEQRPSYVGADLHALFRPHPAPAAGQPHEGWTATVMDRRLEMLGAGPVDAWWRIAAQTAWAHLDRTGQVVDTDGLQPPAPAGRDSVTA